MKVYKVTTNEKKELCNINAIVLCWYGDDISGFAYAEINEFSTPVIGDSPKVEIEL